MYHTDYRNFNSSLIKPNNLQDMRSLFRRIEGNAYTKARPFPLSIVLKRDG